MHRPSPPPPLPAPNNLLSYVCKTMTSFLVDKAFCFQNHPCKRYFFFFSPAIRYRDIPKNLVCSVTKRGASDPGPTPLFLSPLPRFICIIKSTIQKGRDGTRHTVHPHLYVIDGRYSVWLNKSRKFNIRSANRLVTIKFFPIIRMKFNRLIARLC